MGSIRIPLLMLPLPVWLWLIMNPTTLSAQVDSRDSSQGKTQKMNWDSYQRYDVVMDYSRSIALKYPYVTYDSIGVSTEGRDIGLVRIGDGSKQGIFIDGGIHAPEWISVSTATYIMDKLVNSSEGEELRNLFDWYIVPIINVDGYEYTFTTERKWRKTRSKGPDGCDGVDPNRNFDFHWGELGSSGEPCSEFFRGATPFSEPETAAVSNAILSLKSKLKMYLTLHCYGQYWLLPWGYSEHGRPDDYDELIRLGQVGIDSLEQANGTQYQLGHSAEVLRTCSGSSMDWAKGVAGIKYSYTVELPPLRHSGIGYFLPEEQIRPTGEETFRAVYAMAKDIASR